MEQSPSWEVNRSSASQEILWTPKVYYRFPKIPPPKPILSKTYPVHASPSYIHFNIILLSTTGSCKWSPLLRFPHQNHVWPSPCPHTCYMPYLSQSSWPHLCTLSILKQVCEIQGRKFPPRLNWILPSSGLLHGVRRFETDVSGPPIGHIFKGRALQEEGHLDPWRWDW